MRWGFLFEMVGIKGLSFHRNKIKETVTERLPLLEKVFCYLWGVAKTIECIGGLQVLLYTNASKSLPKHFFILKILLCKTESGVF